MPKLTGNNTAVKLDDIMEQISPVPSGDDKGLSFSNQIAVDGEIIAGEDSYPAPIIFQCTEANTTDRVITGAIDVTSIFQSDSGSTAGFFGGTSAGMYLMAGSTKKFEGGKVKFTDLGLVEAENLEGSYYLDNTNKWITAKFMATESNYPHRENAWHIASYLSEQIYFGFDPLTRGVNDDLWEQTTFTINGTEHTYYWARFKIVTGITTDPTVQQIKLHSDRIEFESTGIFRYGRGRVPIQLFAGVKNIVKNSLSDPANEAVSYTPSYSAAYQDNEFANNTIDGFGLIINRKEGLDTSVDLLISISFYVKGIETGDVNFDFETSQVTDGYIYDGNEPYTSSNITETIATPSNLIRRSIRNTVPINQLESNSGIVVNIKRDATAGNTNDTLAANIVITNVVVTGYKWKE